MAPASGEWPGVVAIPKGSVTRPASVTLIHVVCTAANLPYLPLTTKLESP